ncbi:MAG: hypothetical protein ACM3ZC_06310 [Bacteroidota bacterium]
MSAKRRSLGSRLLMILGAAAILLLVRPVAAEEAQVKTELSAFRVVAGQDGKEELLPAERAKPGEIIEYVLVCTNKGKGQIGSLEPTLPIPKGTEYLPGTARPSAVLASLDGRSYAPVPLKRMVKGADGRIREEEVPYREYRFLRWQLGRLEPAKNAMVRARVKIVTEDTASE